MHTVIIVLNSHYCKVFRAPPQWAVVRDWSRFNFISTLHPSLIILLLFYFFEFWYFVHKSLMVCTRAAIFVSMCFSFLFAYFIFYHVTWCHMSQMVTWLSLSLDTKFSHGFPMVSPCFHFCFTFISYFDGHETA